MKKILFLLLVVCGMQVCFASQNPPFLPLPGNAVRDQWVENRIAKMGLKEQIGQLLVYNVELVNDSKGRKQLSQIMKKSSPGAILFGKGSVTDQANLTNYIQSLAPTPLLIAFEGEWGLGGQLDGMPDFPKNAALGSIEDVSLIEQYGKEVARELNELGVHINFAPVADINNNPRNPGINVRSFGADTRLVTDKVLAYAKGLESGGVLAVSKHFPGHGDTKADTDITMPIIPYPRAHLDSTELYPFKKLIDAGLGGVMVGHLKFPALEPDRKLGASFSEKVITGLLKQELGFKGLVFSDALYKRNVAGTPELEIKALKAGNDMILVNGNIEQIQKNLMQAVKDGKLTAQEIEEKCRKVLAYKYMLGLESTPQAISIVGLEERINSAEARQLAAKLRASSLTVLGNYGNVLPLANATGEIAVVSVGNNQQDSVFLSNLGKYAQIKAFNVNDASGSATLSSIRNELKNYQRVIISVSADESEIEKYNEFLASIESPAPLVYTFFSSYRTLLPATGPLSKAAAIVLAHSSHDDIQQYTADVLFGKATASGKLSMPVTGLFALGSGIELSTESPAGIVPEDYGMKSYIIHRGIDSIARAGLSAGAYPGCQILILKDGKPIYDKAFGVHSNTDNRVVRDTDLFDLAELSQTTGTLLAIMKLYDQGKLKLTDKISQHVAAFRTGNKRDITIQELLFHESGLAPNIRFHRETIDDNSVHGPFTQGWVDEWHYTRIGEYTYACSDFKFKKGLMSDVQTPTHKLHVADNMWLQTSFKNTMMQSIIRSELDRKRSVYSPAGFIILQQVIEAIAKMPLDQYLEAEFYAPMGLSRTKYQPLHYFTKDEIMPTASNEYFRRQDLCGYVHDELAACQGGVSGNAGIFSTAREVGRIHQMFLNGGEIDGKRYLSEETCRLFTATKSEKGRRGLGFDRASAHDPNAPLHNPCSPSAPLETYGHIGFTGTCAWADPTNNIVYVFLSNRVCPDVWNPELGKMKIMQNIQELIYKSME